MNLSRGSESSFDVLHSQVGDGVTYQIPVHKIEDSWRGKMVQPTELTPEVKIEKKEEDEIDNKHSEERYDVPRELINYIDKLIVEKKLPLRTLKFDIEFSKSRDDVAKYLSDHAEKIGNIEIKDLDKLFEFIGYAREGSEPEKIVEANTDLVVKERDPIEVDKLNELRRQYAESSIRYKQKIRRDHVVFRRMMKDLGGDKEMPKRAEPVEFVEAREEYLKARKKTKLNYNESIEESAKLSDEEIVKLPESIQLRIKKAVSLIDYYPNAIQFSEDLMLSDVSSIEKIIDPNSFDGMRVEREATIEEKNIGKDSEEKEVTEITSGISSEVPEVIETTPNTSVDKKVAESSVVEQNAFPTEFEGKKLEVVRGDEENLNKIKVFYDNRLIAEGEATKSGGRVKICKEYKSGFLLADTIEEKALRHAQIIIKTLKSV